jgi:alpha-tubulin suppressor-like RCC1 family protein
VSYTPYGWGLKGHNELALNPAGGEGVPPAGKHSGGNPVERPQPMVGPGCALEGRTDIVGIFPPEYACHVLLEDKTTLSFGGRQFAQLCNGEGLGHELNVPEGFEESGQWPALPSLLSGVAHMDCWGDHGIVVLADGTPRTFGGNMWGVLGNGFSAEGKEQNEAGEWIFKEPWAIATTPYAPGWPSVWTAVGCSTGNSVSAVLINHEGERRVAVCGTNRSGQLGLGTSESHFTFVLAPPLGVTAVSCGGNHTLIIAGGKAYACGNNNEGELGRGTTDNKAHENFQEVKGLPHEVTAISAGGRRSYFILKDKSLWFCGVRPDTMNSPLAERVYAPTPEKLLTNVTAVASGETLDMAIAGANREVLTRGLSGFDEGGWGDREPRAAFTPIGLTNAVQVCPALQSSYALTE